MSGKGSEKDQEIKNTVLYIDLCKLFREKDRESFQISFEVIKCCGTNNWDFFAEKFCKDNSCIHRIVTHLEYVEFS